MLQPNKSGKSFWQELLAGVSRGKYIVPVVVYCKVGRCLAVHQYGRASWRAVADGNDHGCRLTPRQAPRAPCNLGNARPQEAHKTPQTFNPPFLGNHRRPRFEASATEGGRGL